MKKNDHAKTQRRKAVFLCAFASLRDHFWSPVTAMVALLLVRRITAMQMDARVVNVEEVFD